MSFPKQIRWRLRHTMRLPLPMETDHGGLRVDTVRCSTVRHPPHASVTVNYATRPFMRRFC